MPGTILIVDGVAINRIVLKVKLAAAFYKVHQAEDLESAGRALEQTQFDLVLLGDALSKEDVTALIDKVAAQDRVPSTPVVLITGDTRVRTRLDLLGAGATDVLTKPLDDAVLLARLRNLVRRQDRDIAMELRAGDARINGFGEQAKGFDLPGRIGLVSGRARNEVSALRELRPALGPRTFLCGPPQVLSGDHGDWDVLVIELPSDPDLSDLALLSDLRARGATRFAGIVVMVPEGRPDLVATGFDLGADDVIAETADREEVALRVAARLRQKRSFDGYRDRLRDGLKASLTDPLTGLHNRRYAVPHLRQALEGAGAAGTQCAVMLADIDHFKLVNDRYGHSHGDAVLREVARRLSQAAGPDATVARTGGEEFLIVLPDATQERALALADRICRAVRATPIGVERGIAPLSVTVSIGVTLAGGHDAALPPEQVIDRADKAMYAAKSHGRNRVTCLRPAA